MTVDKALERLNNKLSLLAAAVGIAAAVTPEKVLPFIYAHWIFVCIYLVVGVAPLQELLHPMKTWEQMRTDPRLGVVWLAKFAALWWIVLVGGCLLIGHERENTSDTARAGPDNQERTRENGAIDPARKNYSSVIEIRGGETLKYIQPASLPSLSQKPGDVPLNAGLVPILYLGHNQKFVLFCGVFGEQGAPPIVKDSTATCP